jgi:hypothetical protein
MNKKVISLFSVIVIVAFIAYMIIDTAREQDTASTSSSLKPGTEQEEMWKIEQTAEIPEGHLKAIAAGANGEIYAGGSTYIKCLDSSLKVVWSIDSPYPVTSLTAFGDTILASSSDQVIILDSRGKILGEWGPFEDKAYITSVALCSKYAAFADAGNRTVFILDRQGAVVSMIGQNDSQFIVPSPYFDIAFGKDDVLFIANTGHRRIETRTISGELVSYFGEPGTAPEAFCGCCNPAHFALVPGGFVTAEKGLNRIKLLNETGGFNEFVSSADRFMASIPLDLASGNGNVIYAANPADSKIYEFRRK